MKAAEKAWLERAKLAYTVACEQCGREPGFVCVDESGMHVRFHEVRIADGLRLAGLPVEVPPTVRHVALTVDELRALCFFLSIVLPGNAHPDAKMASDAYEKLVRRIDR